MTDPIGSGPGGTGASPTGTPTGALGDSGLAPPAIELMKGGGAIRGLGEKLTTDLATGSGTLTVPIAVSPGRDGFGPDLALTYDSASGNGPYGFGWSLRLPVVTRKTDKGLPRYDDDVESDVFVFAGSDDLVPVSDVDDHRHRDGTSAPGFVIERYRTRIEGGFVRVERWTGAAGDVHWRALTPDNVTTIFGRSDASRVVDTSGPVPRVFAWLACESYDGRGNAIRYEYVAEDDRGIDATQPGERNRSRGAQRYLKRILYGNRVPHDPATWAAAAPPDLGEWLFEVVLDYDEGHVEDVSPDPARPVDAQHRLVRASRTPGATWAARPDPFSTYRPGYEVRTNRRCRRVLMFHRFAELGAEPVLVAATELDYADLDYLRPVTVAGELAHPGSTRLGSLLCAVTATRYRHDTDRPVQVRGAARYLTYRVRSLPRLEFAYSRPTIDEQMHDVDAADLDGVPEGVDESAYRWVDLDGEGIAGILAETPGAWTYRFNLGAARFGPARPLAGRPSVGVLTGTRELLIDLDGDGRLDLVDLGGAAPGFQERDDGGWGPFRAFRRLPNLRWDDPNVRLVDLDGDGLADVLVTEHDALRWYPSLAEDGYGPALSRPRPVDEERGPRVLLADAADSVHLADMSGDGLSDLVRVRNGEICYWPNLGHGRFGPKVTMDGAPRLDTVDQFDPARVRLADIDGSGTTDLIYLGADAILLCFNLAGNGWTAPLRLKHFARVDDLATIATVDLLGTGTTCLVWSSPLPGAAGRPLRYLRLMGDSKPHLLVGTANNLGAETRITYAPSTRFSLADKRDGQPWLTRLPFPVHVIERVDTFDRVSRCHFVTRYAYHHGFFDGREREFRGFGLVEQWDTEELDALAPSIVDSAANLDAASHTPPVYTKTWFHTGQYAGRDRVSTAYATGLDASNSSAYYREPAWRDDDAEAARRLLDDTVLPGGLDLVEEHEACRALKGQMLRREVYALDGHGRTADYPSGHPYTVVEQNFTVDVLARRGTARHAVVFAHPRETLTYQYEREPTDPRVSHALVLDVDAFGSVRRSVTVAYPRPAGPQRRPEQATTEVTVSLQRVAHRDDRPDWRRVRMPVESRRYELVRPPAAALRFGFDQVRRLVDALVPPGADAPPAASTIAPERWDWRDDWDPVAQPGGVGVSALRLLEHRRIRYRPDDLGAAAGDPMALLPLGSVPRLGLPGQSHTLAFTSGLRAVFRRPRADGTVEDLLPDPDADAGAGGYVDLDGDGCWWLPSGRVFLSPEPTDDPAEELAYARAHFHRPWRYRDPFGADTVVRYDSYDLLLVESRDALGNATTVGQRTAAGAVTAAGNDYRLLRPWLVTDPNGNRGAVAFDILGLVTATAAMGKPPPARVEGDHLDGLIVDLTDAETLAHLATPLADPSTVLGAASVRLLYDTFAYARSKDGPTPQPPTAYTLAREVHAADPPPTDGGRFRHSFAYSDGFGREIQNKVQAEPAAGGVARWVGSGWVVFDNKNRPVRQYEPFFSATHRFEFDPRAGVSPIICYDPLGRRAAVLHPQHAWEKVVHSAWRQETWDRNDTARIDDPATDSDVGGYLARLPADAYRPTWYARRADGQLGPEEQAAARNVAVHAGTPEVAHLDALGRPFLSVVRNRVKYSDRPAAEPPVEEAYETRVRRDLAGNPRRVVDARGRVLMRYAYDLLGRRVHWASMEAGSRWVLPDAVGKPLYAWDSREHRVRSEYDALRRPTHTLLRAGADRERLVSRIVYGESLPDPTTGNLRGRPAQTYDQAGTLTIDEHDFKGNLLAGRRQLCHAYADVVDWSGSVAVDAETYPSRSRFDALSRPVERTSPDGSVTRYGYNAAGLVETIGVAVGGRPAWTALVASAEYNARGQRTGVRYANGVSTAYTYDPATFRLTDVVTARDAVAYPDDEQATPPDGWPGRSAQRLHFTYDPIGNVTAVRDDAQQTIFFRNRRVDPGSEYTYDACYRLVEATGREHLGQGGAIPRPSYRDGERVGLDWSENDGLAMARYRERFRYDAVGNLGSVEHAGTDPARPGWTRDFAYAEASQLEAGVASNRLTGSAEEVYSTGGDGYDPHGNMLRLPHLAELRWDHQDALRMSRRQAVDAVEPERAGERTWYVYDDTGRRVRKVTEDAVGDVREERVYLDEFELHRRHGAHEVRGSTLHVGWGSERVALVETRREDQGPTAELIRYQFGNHQGSSTMELDGDANVISYEEYTPYGSTAYQAVRGQARPPKRFRYLGKERDEETGLYFHGSRCLAPWLGRWVSPDPGQLGDGPNPYAYCRGNPVTLLDPSGGKGKPAPDAGGAADAGRPDGGGGADAGGGGDAGGPGPPDAGVRDAGSGDAGAGDAGRDTGDDPADAGTANAIQPSRVYLNARTFKLLDMVLGHDPHARFVPNVRGGTSTFAEVSNGQIRRLTLGKGYGVLEVDTVNPSPKNPWYWQKLAELTRCATDIVLLTSVDIHTKFDTSKLPRKGGRDAGPAGGVLDLDPIIPSWGITLAAGSFPLAGAAQSPFREVTVVFLLPDVSDAKDVMHELFLHTYLLCKGRPWTHDAADAGFDEHEKEAIENLPPEVSDLILRLTEQKDLPPDTSVFKFEIIDAGVPPPPPQRVPVLPVR